MPENPAPVALRLSTVRTGARSALRVAKDAYYFGIPSLKKPRTDAAGLAEIRTNFGVFYVRPDDTDMEVLRDIFIKRAYELDFNLATSVVRREYNAMVEAGRKPLILDVGANAGFASRFFAEAYPSAAIIAIEPDPDNYRVLCENVKSTASVTSIKAAIGASDGFVSLDKTSQDSWSVRTVRADNGVPMVTINDLLASNADKELLITKIDIEGFESDLFLDNLEWIEKSKIVIVEPHDWAFPNTSQSLQRAMIGLGREMVILGDNLAWIR